MYLKRLTAAVLAVLFAAFLMIPASAFTGGTISDTTTYNGVQGDSYGEVTAVRYKGSLTMTPLPNAPHLPESDICGEIIVLAYYYSGSSLQHSPLNGCVGTGGDLDISFNRMIPLGQNYSFFCYKFKVNDHLFYHDDIH